MAAITSSGHPRGEGLYRIRGDDDRALLYVGQGAVPARLRAHLAKIRTPSHPQGDVFESALRLEASWVMNAGWQVYHRLELENDLIAAHIIETGKIPDVQFLG